MGYGHPPHIYPARTPADLLSRSQSHHTQRLAAPRQLRPEVLQGDPKLHVWALHKQNGMIGPKKAEQLLPQLGSLISAGMCSDGKSERVKSFSARVKLNIRRKLSPFVACG